MSKVRPPYQGNLLQRDAVRYDDLSQYGVSAAFRSGRILVGKTPNLTASAALA